MDTRILLTHLLRSPHSTRTLLALPLRPHPPSRRTYALLAPHARHISLPTILRPSFWREMVPRPLRRSSQQQSEGTASATQTKRTEWNPATPYIVLALLVGSQAIQILWLKQEREGWKRAAERRIGVLRGVVEGVQRGEDVDVEGVLGGVERWEELIKEVEEEELMFQSSEEKKRGKAAVDVAEEKASEEPAKDGAGEIQREAKVRVESLGGAKFY